MKNKSDSRKLNPSAFALACGVNRSAVTRWQRKSTWSFGPPPWDSSIVDEVKAWAATFLQEDRAALWRPQRSTTAAEESVNPMIQLNKELCQRFAVHPYYWLRVMLGLIERLDQWERPFRKSELVAVMKRLKYKPDDPRMYEWLDAAQSEARDVATVLPLATREAVDHYFQTGKFQHITTEEQRASIKVDQNARWEQFLENLGND